MQDPDSLAEAGRFVNALVAQEELDKLDEAINALSVDDLRNVVRRLIIDVGPINRW